MAEDFPTFILPGLDMKEVGGEGVVLGASSVVVVAIRVPGGKQSGALPNRSVRIMVPFGGGEEMSLSVENWVAWVSTGQFILVLFITLSSNAFKLFIFMAENNL
jgi:hypothetical protein